jgi:hypothetical protein
MGRINILCLSDAHVTKRHSVDQKIVLDAFIDSLKRACDLDLAPHYVVFSGDLVNNPDEDDAYDSFMEALLIPVLETTSVDLNNFVFCSGNHEVSRAACEQHTLEMDMIASKFGDHKYFNDLYATGRTPSLIAQKMAAYAQFMRSVSAEQGTKADPFYNVWDFPASNISFVALNSSAFSLGSLRGNEQGKLNFPDLAVNKAFSEIPKNRHIISLQHHPLSWFQDDSAKELRTTINQKSAIHLFGHLHEAAPATLTCPIGVTAFIQAPSLFSSRNYLNGYSIISLAPDPTRAVVAFQTYFENQRAFRAGENVAPDGIFYPNSESREFWINQPLLINLKKYRRWLAETALVEKLDYLNETTVGKKLSEVFVYPPLSRVDIDKNNDGTSGDPFTYTRASFEHILGTLGNVLIFCPQEHGQTSFAKQLALNHLLQSNAAAMPRLPLIVDCVYLRNYVGSLMGLLKAQAPDLTTLGRNLDTILAEGLALIIFENVDPTDKEQISFLKQVVKNFQRVQFVVLIRSTFSGKLDALLELNFPDIVETLHIQPYTRTLVREFIRKSRPPLRESEDRVLDQIIARFRQLGLPLTPVYLSLLFSIFEQDASFQPLNTASLVDNFVEKVLGKASMDARREVFDYQNRVGLLAFLAQKMTEKDLYSVDFTEIYSWSSAYLKELGFEQDIQSLIKSFTHARILSTTGNRLQFQHDMFLAYFVAQRMIINDEFSNRIIESAQRFLQEIDIYCGLKRFDEKIITTLEAKFDDVDRRLMAEFPGLPDLDMLDAFELPRDRSIEAMFTSVTEQLIEKKLTDTERDQILENEAGTSAASAPAPRIISRPEVTSVALEWYNTLRAYTISLKNLEEIGAEKKKHHLHKALQAWGRLVGFLILLLRLAFEVDVNIGGATLNLGKVFGDAKPTVLRYLLLNTPTIISGFIRDNLGTEKLRLILASITPAGNTSATVRFLNEGLYLDLRLPEFIRRVDNFRKSLGDRQFLNDALFLKLLDSYLRFPLPDEPSDTQYRRLMAEVRASVARLRGVERDKFIAAQLQQYKKDQLKSRLKND